MCYLRAKKLFPSSAPAVNRLLGCGFVLVFHWCTKPINRCSLSRPFINLGLDEVDLVLCGVFLLLLLSFSNLSFQVRCSLSSGWKWVSRKCDCGIRAAKGFGEEVWPWQRTINNYHYNVSDSLFFFSPCDYPPLLVLPTDIGLKYILSSPSRRTRLIQWNVF